MANSKQDDAKFFSAGIKQYITEGQNQHGNLYSQKAVAGEKNDTDHIAQSTLSSILNETSKGNSLTRTKIINRLYILEKKLNNREKKISYEDIINKGKNIISNKDCNTNEDLLAIYSRYIKCLEDKIEYYKKHCINDDKLENKIFTDKL